MTVTFEGYERRADKIDKCLADNGIASLEEALQICTDKGFNPREIVNNTQSIAFQNAEWAYTLGCALAVKRGAKTASEAAAIIGEGIQAFTVPAPSPRTARSVWATATWALCCSPTTPSASPSWPATSPSLPPRALSAWL